MTFEPVFNTDSSKTEWPKLLSYDFYSELANRAPALPRKNLMSLRLLEFGVPWGRVGAVMLVLRTIPGLVGRSVQNLVEIGLAVRA